MSARKGIADWCEILAHIKYLESAAITDALTLRFSR
jgi:hypothetical protein